MLAVILMIALLFSTAACTTSRSVSPTESNVATNYTQLITQWATERRPHDPFRLKVTMIRPVMIQRGATAVLAVQVDFFYKGQEAESFILFIHENKIHGWVYAGEPEEEVEEDAKEIFTAKDQA
jgi:hypothetical protein